MIFSHILGIEENIIFPHNYIMLIFIMVDLNLFMNILLFLYNISQ